VCLGQWHAGLGGYTVPIICLRPLESRHAAERTAHEQKGQPRCSVDSLLQSLCRDFTSRDDQGYKVFNLEIGEPAWFSAHYLYWGSHWLVRRALRATTLCVEIRKVPSAVCSSWV